MRQLSGMDAAFIHLERGRNQFHIGTLLVYDVSSTNDGLVRFKDILQRFDKALEPNSNFRMKLQRVPFNVDYPYWVKDRHFDIEHHVRHIALPKPGDLRQLCILVARIHARPLDMGRPLWEAYVIEGLDNVAGVSKGGFAVYIKMHHAAADGASVNELTGAIHNFTPSGENDKDSMMVDEGNYILSEGENSPGNIEMLTRAYINTLKQPKRVFDLMQTVIPEWNRSRKSKRFGEKKKPAQLEEHTRFNERISGNIVLGVAAFNLDEIKAVKNAVMGVTVNDVIMAVVSGAMQKYLTSKNEQPRGDLSVAMPINIRPMIKGLRDTESMGNMVSIAKISLHNTIKRPIKRLLAINASANESKAYQNAVGAKLMLDVSRTMPAYFLSAAGRMMPSLTTADAAPINTVVTNVPGSQVPMYLAGARLVTVTGIGMVLEGIGIFHTVTSHCGVVTVSFQACRDMMPDPGFYRDCVLESFEELKEASQEQTIVNKKKRKTVNRMSRSKKSTREINTKATSTKTASTRKVTKKRSTRSTKVKVKKQA